MHAVHTQPQQRAGGAAGLLLCRGLGEEGEEGGGRAPPARGWGAGWGGDAEALAGPHARLLAGGAGPPPGACSLGWRVARHLRECLRWLGGMGLLLLRTSGVAEAAAGTVPLQPAPAPLPIEALWGCCVTAAPGGGSVSSSAMHPCTPGGGGGGGGEGGEGGGPRRPQR